MKTVGALCLAMLMGFVLGSGFHTVRAESPVKVYIDSSTPDGMERTMRGTQVVGFSCVPGAGGADCYVLSTK